MRISYDDQYLITVSEDSCLFVYKISDKEGRGKRDRDVPYAEEVLITRSDLEEKVCRHLLFPFDFCGVLVLNLIKMESIYESMDT